MSAKGISRTVAWTELHQAFAKDGVTLDSKAGPAVREWFVKMIDSAFDTAAAPSVPSAGVLTPDQVAAKEAHFAALVAREEPDKLATRHPAPTPQAGPSGGAVAWKYNKFHRNVGWKLHDCADGQPCSADIGGGCARGFCARMGIGSHDPDSPDYAPDAQPATGPDAGGLVSRLLDRVEVLAGYLNDAFCDESWSDVQRIADKLRTLRALAQDTAAIAAQAKEGK